MSLACTCPFCGLQCQNDIRPYVCTCKAILGKNGWVLPEVFSNERNAAVVDDNPKNIEAGRQAWARLHSERHGSPQFLEDWKKQIPQGCSCRTESELLFKNIPPDFSSPDSWFEWTVKFHNAVNAKLGKTIVDMSDALKLWRYEKPDCKYFNENQCILATNLAKTKLPVIVQESTCKICMAAPNAKGINKVTCTIALKALIASEEFNPASNSSLLDCANVKEDEVTEVVVGKPGSALKRIMASVGISEPSSCYCQQYAKKMDVWGRDGCIERRNDIIEYLKSQSSEWFDIDRMKSGGYKSIESLVDEAIKLSSPNEDERYAMV